LGNMSGRLKVMSVFSYPRSEEETNLILKEDNQNKVLWGLFHSSPIFFTRSILGRYFNYFSGKYLFFMGDWSNARNSTVYQGVAYYPDLLFLLLGLGILFRRKRNPFENFMFFWLVVSPLPAALTRDNISSVRSFTMVIPLVYIIAVGMSGMLGRFDKFSSTHKFILYSLFFILYSLFFVRFLDLYFLHDPLFSSESRLYGYKEMINYLLPQMNGKNKVIITSSFGQPYIFYLFCSKYDPGRYQKNAKLKEDPQGDVGEVERIENIEFRKIYWPDDRGNINSLFVGNEFELPLKDIIGQERINFLKEIKFLNGKTAFRIVKTE